MFLYVFLLLASCYNKTHFSCCLKEKLMLPTVGGAKAGMSCLFNYGWRKLLTVWRNNFQFNFQVFRKSYSLLRPKSLMGTLYLKECYNRNDFKRVLFYCLHPPSDSKSLRSASIFLKSCMAEHLKWARTSPWGTDSDLIGARQAASAYLYNYVIWRLSKGRKETAKLTKEKLKSEDFIICILKE